MSGVAKGMDRPDGCAPTPACDPGARGSCAICGDEALPASVVAVEPGARTAAVVFLRGARADGPAEAGEEAEVATDLVDAIAVGDVVLVHQGFVIGRVGAP